MQILSDGNTLVIALAPGEEILESLLSAAESERIRGGPLTGIGSLAAAEIAYFDADKAEYIARTFEEPMEIGSLMGGFSTQEGKPHVHVHVTVAGPELLAFTGHLNRGVVGTACEIYVSKLGCEVKRAKESAAGFNPLELK